MRMFRDLTRAVCVAALFTVALVAQSDRGTITGTVSDPASAVVPGAKVTVKNTETGTVAETVTTPTGNYTLASLPAGAYELVVEAPGFKKSTQTGIQVQVAQTQRLDLALQVGSATESVTVSAEAPMMKTESAEQSINVIWRPHQQPADQLRRRRRQRREHPQLDGVRPAVSRRRRQCRKQPHQRRAGRQLQDHRRRPGSHQPESGDVDQHGQPGLRRTHRGVLAADQQLCPGVRPGGRRSVQLHHQVRHQQSPRQHYEYFTNEALDAQRAFVFVRPISRKQDYGGQLTGPVWIPKVYDGRNRTFFSFNYEAFRNHLRASASLQTVPIAGLPRWRLQPGAHAALGLQPRD